MATTKKTQTPKETKKYKVKIMKNGPYLVSGGVPLAEQIIHIDDEGQCHGWDEGKKYPLQENYALCRCGHSKNKPFCDGTHIAIKFIGTETASRETYLIQAKEYKGLGLDLTDNEILCVGAGFCDRGEGAWKLTKDSGNPDSKKIAIEEACDCPSGRLVAWNKAGKAIEPKFEPSIGIISHPPSFTSGPIWIRGGIPVESADGTTYEVRNRVTLCSCGKSFNKPFCDGSHIKK